MWSGIKDYQPPKKYCNKDKNSMMLTVTFDNKSTNTIETQKID